MKKLQGLFAMLFGTDKKPKRTVLPASWPFPTPEGDRPFFMDWPPQPTSVREQMQDSEFAAPTGKMAEYEEATRARLAKEREDFLRKNRQ